MVTPAVNTTDDSFPYTTDVGASDTVVVVESAVTITFSSPTPPQVELTAPFSESPAYEAFQ